MTDEDDEEDGSAAEDERKDRAGDAPPARSSSSVVPAALAAERTLEPEPLICFLGLTVGALGLFIRSDDNAEAASFEAFSDPAVVPCSLHAKSAAAVPVGAAFVLGCVTALEPHEDGSGAMVATIEQLHFDGTGTGAQAAIDTSVPPDEVALGISFRRLGIGRIVLFFHTGVGEQYVAFNQGQSNWYLAQESVTSASRRAREERAEAGGIDRGSDLPGFVYGEVVMMAAQVASAEVNPYQLPLGVCYHEATVALLGVAPI